MQGYSPEAIVIICAFLVFIAYRIAVFFWRLAIKILLALLVLTLLAGVLEWKWAEVIIWLILNLIKLIFNTLATLMEDQGQMVMNLTGINSIFS